MDWLIEVLLIAGGLFFLVIFSAFFSASETAFTSVNKIKLKNLANEGNIKAEKALRLIDDYDKFLSTILVGNNLVNILASSLCTLMFALIINRYEIEEGFVSVALSTGFMLVVLLIFGEITPKRLAKANAEKYAMRTAGTLTVLMKVLAPIGLFFTYFAGIFTGKKKNEDVTLTEEELVVMIDQIKEEGTLEKTESDLIKSAIKFDDKQVSEIITPRVDIVGIEKNSSIEDLKNVLISSEFSRIPVYEETIDKIIGVIYAKDFFSAYFENKNFTIEKIVRPVKCIPETATVQKALTEIQRSRVQMLVVKDSFGGTIGIVSLEDVLEELVGEIWDESDEVQEFIIKEKTNTYIILGDAGINDVMDTLNISLNLDGYDGGTIGGFIQYKLDKVPKKWDKLETDEVEMIVMLVKDQRISKIRTIIKPKAIEENQS